ncbi:MAG TPA: TonB-dependent receptor [Opitutaceae bacterium]|nr:TonB-dependent receptor [Opitutaceae bacterium]
MSFSLRYPLLLLCLAGRSSAQAPAAAPASPPAHPPGEIHQLDKFVVSSGLEPKTAFDLAQGTSVLAGEDLHRLAEATLGETLGGMPGVSASYYGPAASRPVIRGLGGDRIRVLDNGIGALDASSVSPDHQTALEPLFASRIEVLRGPSTLLYGSSAVGGAVNVISNSIPDTAPDGQPRGALELRAGGAARERAGILAAGGGSGAFAAQVNVLKQKTSDLGIPGVARIDQEAPHHQPDGTLPGSALETFSGSLGGTLFWGAGRAGGAVSHYETEYGVPNGGDVVIRMRQTRFDFEGNLTRAIGVLRSGRVRLGAGDYTHSELGDAGTSVNTTFKNKAWEGRLELAHATIGPVTGTLGAQATHSDFAAVGEEVATPPSLTRSGAVFAVEEVKLGAKASLQIGGRHELQRVRLRVVDPGLPRVTGYSARSGQKKTFGAPSGSIGVVVRPAPDWSIGANVAYAERVPTAQELFANGPHGGTGAYEVGTTGLHNEKSTGFDLSIRHRGGFVTGSVSAFVNRFRDFIFEEKLPATAISAAVTHGLTPMQFVARDARFHGYEAEISFHLLEETTRHVHLDLMTDYVHAEQTSDRQPLPRIAPRRTSARLAYDDGRWGAEVEMRHAARQDRFTRTETATSEYTLVNASVTYLIPRQRTSYEMFLRGKNLTDAEAREHTSFLKQFAPLPGRGVTAGVRMTF